MSEPNAATPAASTPPSTDRATWQTAALIGLGVTIQALSLQVVHPLSFLAFAFFGAGLVGLGLVRLWLGRPSA